MAEAWELYRTGVLIPQRRQTATIQKYEAQLETLFGDWLQEPVAAIARSPERLSERHRAITEDRGAWAANRAMRTLRVIYRHAASVCPDLPALDLDRAVRWNAEPRRADGVPLDGLAWQLAEIAAEPDARRRDSLLFALLSGCPIDALTTARPEHVDWRRRILRIPGSRGFARRPMDVPLSRPMLRCLIRLVRLADDRSQRSEMLLDLQALSPGRFRPIYRAMAQAAQIGNDDLRLLTYRSVPAVGQRAGSRLNQHLRERQEAISAIAMAAVTGLDV